MAVLKLAAGIAVGYVLGSRAGREKYEQIAETARKLSAHPTVVQAQEQAKTLMSSGVGTVNAKLETAKPAEPLPVAAEPAAPVVAPPAVTPPAVAEETPPARRKRVPTSTTSGITGEPLA